MTVLLAGIAILGSVLGLFYLKDRVRSTALSRLAYSGLVMRLTVLSVAMIAIGAMLTVGKLVS